MTSPTRARQASRTSYTSTRSQGEGEATRHGTRIAEHECATSALENGLTSPVAFCSHGSAMPGTNSQIPVLVREKRAKRELAPTNLGSRSLSGNEELLAS